jgi:crotonobetainyl-CoA:carnitine CoA-transferase CaiB-like acyl-CoA transferase
MSRRLLLPRRRAGDEVPDRPAPQLGADTEAILLDLGYDRQAIDTLRADGAI